MSRSPSPPTQTTVLPGQTTTPLPSSGPASPTRSTPPSQGRIVVIALALAVLAVILVNIYIVLQRQQNAVGTFTVYRLTANVQPGDALSASVFEPVQIPETFRDSFETAIESANGEPSNLGDRFQVAAGRNDIVTYDLFERPDSEEIDRLLPGSGDYRLYAIPVLTEDLVSVVRPNARVDIVGTFNIDGEARTVVVMENVFVASIGGVTAIDEQSRGAGDDSRFRGFRSIDILLTQREALQFSMLKRRAVGEFELLLRNSSDIGRPSIQTGGINPDLLRLINYDPISNDELN